LLPPPAHVYTPHSPSPPSSLLAPVVTLLSPHARVVSNPMSIVVNSSSTHSELGRAHESYNGAVTWQMHYDDAKNIWYVSSAGEAVWELPPGAVLS